MSKTMEKQPQFIKEFSKEQSSEERQQTAQEIRVKRKEYFEKKETHIGKQTKLRESIRERDAELAEQLKSMQELGVKIEELSSSGLSKLLHYFELKKVRADIVAGEKSYEELKQEQETIVQEEEIQKAEVEIPPKLQEAKEMVNNFYKEQKEKWAESEYTKEDITKYFSEEHLASLSLDDYTALLKRFPSEMVTHVTRQGVRDHFEFSTHKSGLSEYHDGFMKMLEDGHLRSPLCVYLIEGAKEEAIAKFLDLERFETKEQALEYLKRFIKPELQSMHGLPTYSDKMATHFIAEAVADAHYGAEKGNEIFIAYPSAFIASQYYFQGDLTNPEIVGAWASEEIEMDEDKGMDLDVGVVFIPENMRVDKETGSRYELDEDKKRIINHKHKETIREIVESTEFQKFAKQALTVMNQPQEFDISKRVTIGERLAPFQKQLEQEFGIKHHGLRNILLDRDNLSYFLESTNDTVIEKILEKKGLLYLEAQNTVKAEEFWENYFTEHPDQRPSKIVYYKESNPTNALKMWKIRESLDKKSNKKDLGFPERNVSGKSQQATAGMDRFRSIAEEVIEEYFS